MIVNDKDGSKELFDDKYLSIVKPDGTSDNNTAKFTEGYVQIRGLRKTQIECIGYDFSRTVKIGDIRYVVDKVETEDFNIYKLECYKMV